MHNKNHLIITTLLLAFTQQIYAEDSPLPKVAASDQTKIFKAAGFKKTAAGWEGNCDTGQITVYQDINGDGLKDAVISDSSSMCYGRTGVGYTLMSQQKNGTWKKLFDNSGIPTFLETKGKDGWPDIENGGPGFCFAIYRWDGKQYDVNRYEYEGKTCSLL